MHNRWIIATTLIIVAVLSGAIVHVVDDRPASSGPAERDLNEACRTLVAAYNSAARAAATADLPNPHAVDGWGVTEEQLLKTAAAQAARASDVDARWKPISDRIGVAAVTLDLSVELDEDRDRAAQAEALDIAHGMCIGR